MSHPLAIAFYPEARESVRVVFRPHSRTSGRLAHPRHTSTAGDEIHGLGNHLRLQEDRSWLKSRRPPLKSSDNRRAVLLNGPVNHASETAALFFLSLRACNRCVWAAGSASPGRVGG